MFNTRSGRLLGALLLAMAIIVTIYGEIAWSAATDTAVAAPTTDSWPAMTVVYRDQGKRRGLTASADTTVWKLSYQNDRQWRKEVLEDSANPDEVGTVYSFDGTTYTVYSSVVKQVVYTGQYPDAPMIPERWFFPGLERGLERMGYTKQVDAGGQRVRYVKTESLPCEPDNRPTGRKATGITQPDSCATSATYQSTETLVYRTDIGVPVEVVTQLEGQTVREIVVTQLMTP